MPFKHLFIIYTLIQYRFLNNLTLQDLGSRDNKGEKSELIFRKQRYLHHFKWDKYIYEALIVKGSDRQCMVVKLRLQFCRETF